MRGTKRKRREGVWEVRVYLGRDPVTGKEKQMSKTVYGGAKAADEVLRDLIGNKAPRTDGMGVSFGQLLDEWLAECERLDLSPTTLRAYRSQVEQTIRPALGKIPLTRLTAKHLDDLYGAMKDAGKSPKTIRNDHAIISSALHQAARWGWVRTNVAELAKPTCGSETTPRVQRPRRMPPLSWLTPERRSTQPSGATSRRTRGGACSPRGCHDEWTSDDVVSTVQDGRRARGSTDHGHR
jgi:integrase